MIGAFRSSYCSIVQASSCSLSGPLSYRSPVVVFLDRGYTCFRSFNSTIPVDVIRVKSYVNSFLDPTCVPVRISINKLDLIPDRIVAALVRVFRNGRGLGTGAACFVSNYMITSYAYPVIGLKADFVRYCNDLVITDTMWAESLRPFLDSGLPLSPAYLGKIKETSLKG